MSLKDYINTTGSTSSTSSAKEKFDPLKLITIYIVDTESMDFHSIAKTTLDVTKHPECEIIMTDGVLDPSKLAKYKLVIKRG